MGLRCSIELCCHHYVCACVLYVASGVQVYMSSCLYDSFVILSNPACPIEYYVWYYYRYLILFHLR